MRKVLITDSVHPLLIEGLAAKNFEIVYEPAISIAKVRESIDQYEGLIVNSKIVMDVDLFNRAQHLKFVGRLGSGMEIFDQPYARKMGVELLSSPEGNRNAVAEHALGMLLCLSNKILLGHQQVIDWKWDRESMRGWELDGKTIGIIGFGNTGRQFAQKFRGWNVKILAFDKYKERFAEDMRFVNEVTTIEDTLQCDVISLHLPLSEETKGLVDKNFLRQCKRGAILLNTSRGAIVKTVDLLEALQSNQLGGACLDVYEKEPPSASEKTTREAFERLFLMPNVVLSPHVAGWTMESKKRMAEVLLAKIDDLGY